MTVVRILGSGQFRLDDAEIGQPERARQRGGRRLWPLATARRSSDRSASSIDVRPNQRHAGPRRRARDVGPRASRGRHHARRGPRGLRGRGRDPRLGRAARPVRPGDDAGLGPGRRVEHGEVLQHVAVGVVEVDGRRGHPADHARLARPARGRTRAAARLPLRGPAERAGPRRARRRRRRAGTCPSAPSRATTAPASRRRARPPRGRPHPARRRRRRPRGPRRRDRSGRTRATSETGRCASNSEVTRTGPEAVTRRRPRRGGG